MEFRENGNTLTVSLKGDLNYKKSVELYSKGKKFTEIYLEFSCSKFVDSEGIKTLYLLKKEGKRIHIKNPPKLFFKAVKILSLEELLECIED